MRKPLKFIALGLAGLVALGLAGALLVPILFRDQIVERLKLELNRQLDATVSFAEVDVSLLSTFPTLAAEVTELSIVGKGDFEGISLFSAKSAAAGLDIVALVFGRSIVVESISIREPEVHVVIDELGRANYDIADQKAPGAHDVDDALTLQIQRYQISGGSFIGAAGASAAGASAAGASAAGAGFSAGAAGSGALSRGRESRAAA